MWRAKKKKGYRIRIPCTSAPVTDEFIRTVEPVKCLSKENDNDVWQLLDLPSPDPKIVDKVGKVISAVLENRSLFMKLGEENGTLCA